MNNGINSPKQAPKKRFNIMLPVRLLEDLEKFAEEEQVTVIDLIRDGLRFYLTVLRATRGTKGEFIYREEVTNKEKILVAPL
ncbi:MAG: hypothetical protein KIH69_019840 [Anaerolineae bacterium]|nr:hypothetical protein [Anaerolineae bacterium]